MPKTQTAADHLKKNAAKGDHVAAVMLKWRGNRTEDELRAIRRAEVERWAASVGLVK